MNQQQIIAIAKSQPYALEDVQWVHDQLPASHQNENSINKVFELVRSTAVDFKFLLDFIKNEGDVGVWLDSLC